MSDTLTTSVSQENGDAVIHLNGIINRDADEAINTAFNEAEALGPQTIVLDFEAVEYINSTGIALIVGLLSKARIHERKLAAVGLSEHYVEIFNITRLSDFIAILQP